ncbi:MAG: hypothetical protein ABEL97_03760 [Salinibacter sp.]
MSSSPYVAPGATGGDGEAGVGSPRNGPGAMPLGRASDVYGPHTDAATREVVFGAALGPT